MGMRAGVAAGRCALWRLRGARFRDATCGAGAAVLGGGRGHARIESFDYVCRWLGVCRWSARCRWHHRRMHDNRGNRASSSSSCKFMPPHPRKPHGIPGLGRSQRWGVNASCLGSKRSDLRKRVGASPDFRASGYHPRKRPSEGVFGQIGSEVATCDIAAFILAHNRSNGRVRFRMSIRQNCALATMSRSVCISLTKNASCCTTRNR